MAGLLWFYAAWATGERRMLSLTFGFVFLILGLVQLKVNSARFKDEENPAPDKEAR
jgi:hypothetical protein